jgi:sugar phosphate isomerase/epimerase
LALGRGLIDFGALVGALREVGYEGFLSMEYEGIFFGYMEDPWEIAAQTKSFLDNILS